MSEEELEDEIASMVAKLKASQATAVDGRSQKKRKSSAQEPPLEHIPKKQASSGKYHSVFALTISQRQRSW